MTQKIIESKIITKNGIYSTHQTKGTLNIRISNKRYRTKRFLDFSLKTKGTKKEPKRVLYLPCLNLGSTFSRKFECADIV